MNALPPEDAGGDVRNKPSSHESEVQSEVVQCSHHNHEVNKSGEMHNGARCTSDNQGYADKSGHRKNVGVGPPKTGPESSKQQKTGAALWDIFRREDSDKLQDYLRRHASEFRHVHCNPVKQVSLFFLVAVHRNPFSFYIFSYADQ